jgi:putative membrane protein
LRSTFAPIIGLAVLFACSPDNRRDTAAGGASEIGMSADTTVGADIAGDTGAAVGTETASSGTATGAGDASLSGIFSRLEVANTAEIQTGKLAATQARSPEVRQIAQRLVADHTKNRAELEALAQSKGVNVLPPAGGNTARDTSGVLALKSLEGAEFDSAFVAAQLEAHQTNIDAIRTQMLPAAQDEDVRQYLQKTRAAMEEHLASLQKIQDQLQS